MQQIRNEISIERTRLNFKLQIVQLLLDILFLRYTIYVQR